MGTRDCQHICDESSPAIGEAGKTGDWRDAFPSIDNEKCIPTKQNKPACFLCWLYCPEAVVSKTVPIQIDMEYCKGCGICAEICPAHAMTMISEESLSATEKA
jgi:pyruvate ferredoxin oxidoreductase delta subunit